MPPARQLHCSYIVLNIATGYLYGFWDGLCITIIGAAVGGLVSFLACRQLAKGYVTSLLSSYENLKQIIRVLDGAALLPVSRNSRGTGRQGFKIVMMTRLTPVPFGLLNALFSVCWARIESPRQHAQTSKISKRDFFIATIIGSLPTQACTGLLHCL